MRLILEQKWDDALFYLAEHPYEAQRWDTIPVLGKNRTNTRCLPLHAACALSPPTLAIIEALAQAYPDALKDVDSRFARTPLHIACCKGASSEILHYLMEQYRSAASKQDIMDRTALHYAMFDHAPLETATELLRLHPEAARVQDCNGWLPLHVASRSGATQQVLTLLIDAYPDGLKVKTTVCGLTPFACANRHHVFTEKNILDLLNDNKVDMEQALT
jgi:ankyrin repeat protein